MKWRKLGKIFDPDTHGLPAECVGWAQSPQPLVLSDRVRIYFSTRMLDPVAEDEEEPGGALKASEPGTAC